MMTVEEFEAFVDLPENAERYFEYIGGKTVEVPSRPYASSIAMRINMYIGQYDMDDKRGHITGKGGGYQVSGERYAPDVAFISKTRQPTLSLTGYNPLPPDLAVEVVSPSDLPRNLNLKIANYLAAGTVVWAVYTDVREVVVVEPNKPGRIFGINDTLDGGDILPGFQLPIRTIFPDKIV